jgi:flavin reductase (DIM6/NTAB) family NADH-FMN oxidoreductase RutF
MADGQDSAEFTAREFRDALGCFATGIAIVTGRDAADQPLGVTVNSFASVSLDPPLVSFCLDRAAYSFASFVETRHFAVNMLSEQQQDLSARFARSTLEDKFEGVPHHLGRTGVPLLGGCLCTLECARAEAVDAGDHVILLGRVLHIESGGGARPLLYFRGHYARLLGGPA